MPAGALTYDTRRGGEWQLALLQASWFTFMRNTGNVVLVDENAQLAEADCEGAADSHGAEDRLPKVKWLAEASGVEPYTATVGVEAAADWGLLRNLLECGCPFGAKDLAAALRHVQLEVADWLVDEPGATWSSSMRPSHRRGRWQLPTAVRGPSAGCWDAAGLCRTAPDPPPSWWKPLGRG